MTTKHSQTRVAVINGICTEVRAYLLTGDNNPRACLDINGLTVKVQPFRYGRFEEFSRTEKEKLTVKNLLSTCDRTIEASYREKLKEAIEALEEYVPELEARLARTKNSLTGFRELQFRTLRA